MRETDINPSNIELLEGHSFDTVELQLFVELIESANAEGLLDEVHSLHVSDVAELLGLLSADKRQNFISLIGKRMPAEVFAELDANVLSDVVEYLDLETLVSAVQDLDSDEAVFVLEDMDEADQREVLEQIPESDRIVLQRALDYPESSAGRLMRSEYVVVPPYWSVGQTIDYLREDDNLPDEFLEVFVVEPTHKPIGVVPLNRVLRSKRPVSIQSIIEEDFTVVSADMDREQVARLFERYNLVSVAVIDDDLRMVGVITADDVLEVINEEAGEDILRLGGVVADETVTDTVFEAFRGRFAWLLINLGTAILASLVIGAFGASIEKMVALAILMPIVASMGGNAGTQTLTIAVRGIATRELVALNSRRIILRELGIGLINGLLFAVIIGLVGAVWFNDIWLGGVLALSMIVTLVVAALAGILIPIGLDRIGVDPAVASSVFVTTVTDVIGFLAFLGFATVFLLV